MKRSNFIKNSIVTLLPLALLSSVIFGVQSSPTNETNAYNASPLPTTLNLNDTTEPVIRNYYSALNGLDDNQKRGNNLLKNLKPILSNNQKYYSYDSGSAVWQIYEISDRDWTLSPASNTVYGFYDATTNTITNYSYGTSGTDAKNNPYLHALYVNRDAVNQKRAWGDHGVRSSEATIEREHIWPKSHGFDSGTGAGARGDPMHLWAADGTANGMHSNMFYGYVDKTKTYKDAGNIHSSLFGNLTGSPRSVTSDKDVFEPQDSDKGDIARACFYMVARYNNLAGNDEDISSDNPNLFLTNDNSLRDEKGTSTSSKAFGLGILQDLLEWNRLDPVDEFERHRNNLLYTNFTNNRNPFIDFPQWADIIWGDEPGYAHPSTDEINGGVIIKTVSKIEVTEYPTKLRYTAGENFVSSGMVVKATYNDGTSSNITNYSTSPSRALNQYDTEITVTFSGKSATVPIFVAPQSGASTPYKLVTDISSLNSGDNVVFVSSKDDDNFVNGDFSSTYLNAYQVNIYEQLIETLPTGALVFELGGNSNDGWTFTNGSFVLGCKSNSDLTNNVGTTTWNITINDSETTVSSTSQTEDTFGSIQFNSGYNRFKTYIKTSQKPIQLYEESDPYVAVSGVSLSESSILSMDPGSVHQLTATVSPSNATNKNVIWSSNNPNIVSVKDGLISAVSSGNAIVTATTLDGNFNASCSVHVTSLKTLNSISLSGDYKTEYYVHQPFSTQGLVVTANYSDSSQEDVTEDAEIEAIDTSTVGTKTVNISYNGKTASYQVIVSKRPVEENTILHVLSEQGYENGQVVESIYDSDTGINTTFGKGNGSSKPAYYNSGAAVRLYGGNIITISSDNLKIVNVEIVFGSGDGTNLITSNNGSYSETNGVGTWTGSTRELILSEATGKGNRRISSITIKYSNVYLTMIRIESEEIEIPFAKTEELYEVDASVIAVWSDASETDVTTEATTNFNVDTHRLGNQKISANYQGFSVNFTVKVTNVNASDNIGDKVIDKLDNSVTGTSGTSYKSWVYEDSKSGAVYSGNSAGSNSTIQLRSNNSSGIVQTTSGGNAIEIKVDWHNNTLSDRKISVYGSNTKYNSPEDLFSTETQGVLIGQVPFGSTILEIDNDYAFIGIRSYSGALYLNSIDIKFDVEDPDCHATPEEQATSWGNYFIIKTKGDEGPCSQFDLEEKVNGLKELWGEAKIEYLAMTADSKNEFCSSTASEKIKEALNHYEFIVGYYGKYGLEDFVVDGNGVSPIVSSKKNLNFFTSDESSIIVLVFSIIGLMSITSLVFYKKHKEK